MDLVVWNKFDWLIEASDLSFSFAFRISKISLADVVYAAASPKINPERWWITACIQQQQQQQQGCAGVTNHDRLCNCSGAIAHDDAACHGLWCERIPAAATAAAADDDDDVIQRRDSTRDVRVTCRIDSDADAERVWNGNVEGWGRREITGLILGPQRRVCLVCARWIGAGTRRKPDSRLLAGSDGHPSIINPGST